MERFPVCFEHGVFKVVSSYQVDVYFTIFDQVLERFYDLLDEHFRLLSHSRPALKLILADLHSLDLVLVIIVHDLAREFNLLDELLRNFIGHSIVLVLVL